MTPKKRRKLAEGLAKTIAELCDEYELNRGWDLSPAQACADMAIDLELFAADLGMASGDAVLTRIEEMRTHFGASSQSTSA